MNSYFISRVWLFFLFGIFGFVDSQASEFRVVGVVVASQRVSKAQTVPCKGQFEYSCGSFFTTRGSMRTHFNAVHLKLKPHICPECSRPFAKKQNMLVHRNIHKDIKRFHCFQCRQSFSQKGNMKGHLNTHGEIEKFKCDCCQRRFKCKEYKARHQKVCKKNLEKLPTLVPKKVIKNEAETSFSVVEGCELQSSSDEPSYLSDVLKVEDCSDFLDLESFNQDTVALTPSLTFLSNDWYNSIDFMLYNPNQSD